MGQNYVSEMELDGYQGPDQDFRFKKKKKDFRFYSEENHWRALSKTVIHII